MEALAISEKYNLARYISEQPPYNLLDRRIENELVPLAQKYDLAIAALVAAWPVASWRDAITTPRITRKARAPPAVIGLPGGSTSQGSRSPKRWRDGGQEREPDHHPTGPAVGQGPARRDRPHHRPAHPGSPGRRPWHPG